MQLFRFSRTGLPKKITRKKQFMPNLVSNGAIFVLNILLGMWITPYLIKHLGVAVYGLVPLTNNVTVYLSLISLSLNAAVGRYLTIDLENEDYLLANRTFNTAFWGNIGLSLITLPIVIIFVWFTPQIFDLPEGYERAAQLLFLFSMLTYLLSMVRNSFSVSSWARNRFDLRNLVIGVYQIFRYGIVILLFSLFTPKLEFVGYGLFLAGVIGLGGDIAIWRKLTPQLHIKIKNIDLNRIKQLFGMGGWLVINQVGSLLLLQIDLVVVNIVLGAKSGGEYGAILIFSILIRNLAITISNILSPTIVAKYAQGDIASLLNISSLAVKFLGLLMALPVGLITGFAKPILGLWLGPEFTHLSWLLVLLIVHLTINLSVQPLFSINIALNEVKWPGIFALYSGILNLILAILFSMTFKMNMYGVALAGAIAFTLRNGLYIPIYAARIQKQQWTVYLFKMLPGFILQITLFGLSSVITNYFIIDSWIHLFIFSSIIIFIYFLLLLLILRPSERKYIRSFIS